MSMLRYSFIVFVSLIFITPFQLCAGDSFISLTESFGYNDSANISWGMSVNNIGLVLSDDLVTSVYSNSGEDIDKVGMKNPELKVPKEIDSILSKWKWSARFLRTAQVGLGVSAAVFSLLVTLKIDDSGTNNVNGEIIIDHLAEHKEWLVFGAALSASLYSVFNLDEKSNGMRNAWRNLNEAKMRYEREKGYTIKQLFDAYRDSEIMIGGLTVSGLSSINKEIVELKSLMEESRMLNIGAESPVTPPDGASSGDNTNKRPSPDDQPTPPVDGNP